jgi:hypothetical protein
MELNLPFRSVWQRIVTIVCLHGPEFRILQLAQSDLQQIVL